MKISWEASTSCVSQFPPHPHSNTGIEYIIKTGVQYIDQLRARRIQFIGELLVLATTLRVFRTITSLWVSNRKNRYVLDPPYQIGKIVTVSVQ